MTSSITKAINCEVAYRTPATGSPAGCCSWRQESPTRAQAVHGPLGPIVSLLASLPVADLDVQIPHLEEVLRKYYVREVAS